MVNSARSASVTVIEGFGDGVEPMWSGQPAMLVHGVVCQVTHCHGHGAEGWGQLHPAHRARHGDVNELRLTQALWQCDAESQAVPCSEEELVESIFDIVFAGSHWAKFWVGMLHLVQHSVQGMSKLHDLGWRMGLCHFIDGWPPKVP